MKLKDLEIAKKRLDEKDLTLPVAKEGQVVFEAKSHGVSGFFGAVEKLRGGFDGTSVADRVVGKAIALLCIYAKVRAVYASTINRVAKRLLEENDLYLEWNAIVERILNADRSTLVHSSGL